MKRTLALLIVLSIPSSVLAQSAILIVRHAERADTGMASGAGADPDLSEAGRARASALAAMLKDARITAIFVSEFTRTRQTAEPLAKLLGVEPVVVSAKDTPGLIARLKAASANVLVVGHSNTIPDLVKALGAADSIGIGDSEYDNLLVVTRGATPSLVRLRYR